MQNLVARLWSEFLKAGLVDLRDKRELDLDVGDQEFAKVEDNDQN